MRLVDVLADNKARKRFLNAMPPPLRERMLDKHDGSRRAVLRCDSCVRVAWEWVTGAITR